MKVIDDILHRLSIYDHELDEEILRFFEEDSVRGFEATDEMVCGEFGCLTASRVHVRTVVIIP